MRIKRNRESGCAFVVVEREVDQGTERELTFGLRGVRIAARVATTPLAELTGVNA